MLGNNTKTRTLETLWSNARLGFTSPCFCTKLLHINIYSKLILAKKALKSIKKASFLHFQNLFFRHQEESTVQFAPFSLSILAANLNFSSR